MKSKCSFLVSALGRVFTLATGRCVRLVGFAMLVCVLGEAGAAPPNWIRSDQGLTLTSSASSAPELFTFDQRVYVRSDATLYVQLYNTPCFGWRQVTVPAGSLSFKPVGSCLYAVGPDLWWIGLGAHMTVPTWTQVSSTGLPPGATVLPEAVFQGQLYAAVPNPSGTFDLYRTPDIGKTSMTWTKVVDAGFGDPLNHELGVLIESNGRLIAVTSNTRTDPSASFGNQSAYGTGIEVWESPTGNLGSWSQVNQDGFGTEATVPDPNNPGTMTVRANQDFGSALVYGPYLYIGTLCHWHSGQVWRYNGNGLGGWTDVSPVGLCAGMLGCGGPSRATDMVVYNGLLHLAEGVSTGNLETYDGTTWTIIVGSEVDDPVMGHPFDAANVGILSLAVLPSRPTLQGWTGDKLFALTKTIGGAQVWSYPFSQTPPLCDALDSATVTITPKTATSELFPGAAHTFTVTVDAGPSFDFGEVWVPFEVCVEQHYGGGGGVGCAHGWVPPDGQFAQTYAALYVEPSGLTTDNIKACLWTWEHSVCDSATHTWADTTPPTISITTPANGAKYVLNQSVAAAYSVNDAVGVASITAPTPPGGAVPTSPMGTHAFTVTATDASGNTASESVTYQVITAKQGLQHLDSELAGSPIPAGLKNGFDAKLAAAIEALNKGNKQAALGLLTAFMNMVNAQRGKALTPAQADSWIAQAQAIIQSIQAQP